MLLLELLRYGAKSFINFVTLVTVNGRCQRLADGTSCS